MTKFITNFFLFAFQVAEKVRIDNLQEAELQALLDEVVSYRGKKDGTELFQVKRTFMQTVTTCLEFNFVV